MKSLEETILEAAEKALEEDAAGRDITTDLLVPERLGGSASIIARASGVVSGQGCAEAVFRLVDPSVAYRAVVEDAGRAAAGAEVARVEGPLRAILSGERTALNFLGRLSGIATRTAQFAEKVRGSGIRILDTRKTTPGLRRLEKKAVIDGGGENHRFDLASYILVKENHIEAAGGMRGMIEKMGAAIGRAEVEVRSLDELLLLRDSPPQRIMLDNFPPERVCRAVRMLEDWPGARPEVEVSGGITIDNIESYAVRGVDFISIGSLTSSAASLDLSLLIGPVKGNGDES